MQQTMGKMASFRQWFDQRLDNAILAAQKEQQEKQETDAKALKMGGNEGSNGEGGKQNGMSFFFIFDKGVRSYLVIHSSDPQSQVVVITVLTHLIRPSPLFQVEQGKAIFKSN